MRASEPGRRLPGDIHAPMFRVEVNGRPLSADIHRYIAAVEYESAVDMADVYKILIDNPGAVDDLSPDWTGHKAFQPGNEGDLYVGYTRADRPENHVGRCIWQKHLPEYPRDGVPQLELIGYDMTRKMMDNSGPIISGDKRAKPKVKRPVEDADNQGQSFRNVLHSEVVAYIADMYGMEKDIQSTRVRDNVVTKKGMKHYDLVKGLANINGFDFWVDYDPRRRRWTLHWKETNRNSVAKYIFRYNDGDNSTLLEAQPEYGITDTVTTATVSFFDGNMQHWITAIEIEDIAGPDPIYRQGGGLEARNNAQIKRKSSTPVGKRRKATKGQVRTAAARKQAKDVIQEALNSATAYRIAAGGVSIDVLPPGDRFKNAGDAARFLLRWFRSKQDNFIRISGVLIGVETLRARQVHRILGLGPRLDGDYYFTKVRHQLRADYTCEFTANKVLE